MSSFNSLIQEARGVAGEAHQHHLYTNAVKKYGQQGADALISDQLHEAGISLSNFKTYLSVKQKVQNGALNIREAERQAQEEARFVVAELLG